ncbi:MAG: SDR family oxidoreductase [Planctomycetes bacterium]|nr:SDR family oxidoreductase [Planctomycetota bacterium]
MSSPSLAPDRANAVTLVCGGVRGLGLAAARAMAQRGDRVHLTWRGSAERAAALEAEFPDRVHQLDLEDEAATRELVARLVATEGRLDWVVDSVGAYDSGPLEGVSSEQLLALWRSNVQTALHLAAAVREPLRASHGAMVVFGCAGLDGLRARRDCAAYAAAKSSLLVLVRSLAVEEARFGVRINMVSPGLVPHDGAHPETLDPALHARIPAGRAGTLDEIAAAVLHLTSDASAHTTGNDLTVAGGWML